MSDGSRFSKLLSTGRIDRLDIRNRIIMAPMGTNLAGEDGAITERMKWYYEERAKGGVGLIIVEPAAVDYPCGTAMPCQIAISDDKFLPGLAELAEVIHRHGAKVAIQLHHAGKLATMDLAQGRQPIAASPIPIPTGQLLQDLTAEEILKVGQPSSNMSEGGPAAREITKQEVQHLVQRFAEAAERAKKAGFDGVEIHAGHGYLIGGFLSQATNKRKDEYGGDLKGRARFLLETIKAIRQRVGDTYLVWCQLDGREYKIENGITVKESKEIARMAVKAGIDALHVSGYGGAGGIGFTEAPLVNKSGYLLSLAEAIKEAVEVPVIGVGRISPDMGEAALTEERADFIAMGRALLADPELPDKLKSGRFDEIRPCINCYTCVSQIFLKEPVRCAVNPYVGKEAELKLDTPQKTKKILVAGGGPAGLEAARLAALRGHKVTLCDRERRLGGTLAFAGMMRSENQALVNYLKTQVKKAKVEVRLREEVTTQVIHEVAPDAVVVALGAKRVLPPIPGADGRNVISGDDFRQIMSGRPKDDVAKKLSGLQKTVLNIASPFLQRFYHPSVARQMTRLWMPMGKRVVIIGGQLVGCEMADFLARRRRKVTILERGDCLATQMAIVRRWRVLHELRESGVAMLTGVVFDEITDKGVSITTKDGQKHTIQADTVIIAAGAVPNTGLVDALKDMVPEIYAVGDATQVRLIEGSIADGARIGLAL